MAEHIEIPSGALQGNWVSDQEPVEPSGSAAFCMEALRKLINGDDVWLYNPERKHSVLDSRPQNSASIFVNTGGTSGIPRFARHTWGTMSAAVAALQGVLDNEPIYSWCCLPIWHVAGWMQVVRAIQTNGDVAFGDYRDLADPQKDINLTGRLISLVPTQLHRLILSDLAVSRLRGSRLILLGGAPLREELAEVVRSVGLPVAPTYGMTESAGAVTLLAPDRFLAGENSVGKVLPHANLRLDEETGTLSIRATSMCLGYESLDFSSGEWFETSDLAEQTPEGDWRILGRLDRIVNTGGEKVNPVEVENAVIETRLAAGCLTMGIPDPDWGERLVAFCTPSTIDVIRLEKTLQTKLTGVAIPKLILPVEELPINEMGKPDLLKARAVLEQRD
ncbi:MAG: AMP-binding protein [Opitutae bacterium]|nr:AMP-binding protein [Opitutae bacterium]